MEEERKRKIEEEKRRQEEEEENQRRILEALQFKDVPVKTFYMEYVQRRYKNADVPFPERSSYTIHITSDMVNTNSNINMNIATMTNINNTENIQMQNAQTCSCRSENMLCPGCGRMTFTQNKTGMQTLSQNNENININVNQTQNIQTSEMEQNVQVEENQIQQQQEQQQEQYEQNMAGVQNEECICPQCQNMHKCPGCGRMVYSENKVDIQTMSQNCENANINVNVNETQNMQRSENEQNVVMQQEECICPECQKCLEMSQKVENIDVNVNQTENIQKTEEEQNVQIEQNPVVQQDVCICPDCKQNEVQTD